MNPNELIYISYSLLAGVNDAVVYGRKGAESFTWNEHALFVIERVLLLLLPLSTTYFHPGYAQQAVDAVAFALLYSVLHNTAYYHSRNLIDGTHHNPFTYQSSSSTAKNEYGAKVRWLLGGLGVAVYVVGSLWAGR